MSSLQSKDTNNKNKQNAIEFYQRCPSYVGSQYIQHNPDVEDGKEGFINYFNRMHADYSNKQIRFLRAIGEGDLVALHTHQTWPGNEEYVTMDFFRFDEHGKIVEHWDAIQKVPDAQAHNNTMF